MKRLTILFAGLLLSFALARTVYIERAARNPVPLGHVEKQLVTAMKGWHYLGWRFVPDYNHYFLAFQRAGSVMWFEVYAPTGSIAGKSSPMTLKEFRHQQATGFRDAARYAPRVDY